MSRLRLAACLSLTGRYARFGEQAAGALHAWAGLMPDVEVVVMDDASDVDRVAPCLREVAHRADLLLGPYSTQLMRAANRLVPELDTLLWNHGGSGDDVEAAQPGRVVSVLTPTSRYAEPFVRMLAECDLAAPLLLVSGKGSFGRQVISGAMASAATVGLRAVRGDLTAAPVDDGWNLFCAGTFEQDVETVARAQALPNPPRIVGTVAAGVHEFGRAVGSPDNVYGIAQWLPGESTQPALGPSERQLVQAYRGIPDYPAVQAVAAAVLATHCAQLAGLGVDALWQAATELRTTTLFGAFGIDAVTGAQQAHHTVLSRWDGQGMSRAQ